MGRKQYPKNMVYSQFSNCTLHLKRFTGVYPDGDNEIPQTEAIALRAMLQEDKESYLSKNPGVNSAMGTFKGYITDPFSSDVVTPQDCECVFDKGQVFNLVLHLPPSSPFYDEVSLLGTPCLLQDK